MGPSARTLDFLARLIAVPDGPESLPWQQGGPSSYRLIGQSGSIEVSSDGDDSHPFTLRICTPDGQVVEEAQTVYDDGGYYQTWERNIEALYADARSAALQLPRLLDGLADEFNLPDSPSQDPPTPPADDDIPF